MDLTTETPEIPRETKMMSDTHPLERAPATGPLGYPPPQISENIIEISPSTRARSSLRQRYEAEARVIERRIGGLEKAREMLGLSQRKMAQLLLVDPSAWTRWTQTEQGAPPHVWRALAWYLALQEKYPALDAAFWLQGVARSADGDRIAQNSDEIRAARLHTRSLEIKVQDLSREIARLQQTVPHGAIVPAVADVKAQQETRALANFFLAITFAVLGAIVAHFFF